MVTRLRHNMLVPYIAIGFIILSLFLQPLSEFFKGYGRILVSESILLTDYVSVGGIGPALFNSGSLMLISYILIRKLDLRVTGSIFAGILTIGGFAFFGKNLLNVSIIFLGVFLYSRYKNIKLKSVIIVLLFSTGLSPISSVVMFGVGIPLYYSIPFGIFIGVLSGFLIVELSSHVITFHRGYDLYNVGFAGGILAFAYFSIFKLLDIEYTTNLIYTNDQHLLLLYLYIAICLLFIVVGVILNDKPLKEYFMITKLSGRAVTDFTRKSNQPLTMFNIGVTGLAALVVLLILNVHMNGPVFGGLMTIVGFSAFGKHPRNVLPPMIGVLLVTLIFSIPLSVPVVLAIIFSTALAPIAGEHGFIIGVLSGMLHLPIVTSLGQLHGGVLLYSNGFAAAFTAVIFITVIHTFERSRNNGATRV
jgi:hypothetical protein